MRHIVSARCQKYTETNSKQIERRLSYYVNDKGIRNFTLKVSPILGAYITRGLFNSYVGKWKKKYKCKIKVVEITDFAVLQNELFNEKGDKLDS